MRPTVAPVMASAVAATTRSTRTPGSRWATSARRDDTGRGAMFRSAERDHRPSAGSSFPLARIDARGGRNLRAGGMLLRRERGHASTRPGESGDRRGCPLTLAVNVRRAAYGGRRLRATILGSRKGGGVLREKPVVGAAPPWLVEVIRIGRSGLRVVERGRRHVRRTLRSFRKKHPDTASVLLVCLASLGMGFLIVHF